MNRIEQHIHDSGNARWAFKNATYVWFVGPPIEDERLRSKLRSLLTSDLVRITQQLRTRKSQPVALVCDQHVDRFLAQSLESLPYWRMLRFGKTYLEVENAESVCAKTADVVVCYGKPTERLEELVNGTESLRMIVRDFSERKTRLRVHRPEGNPYGGYVADATRLQRVRPNPTPGMQIRILDIRPKFKP